MPIARNGYSQYTHISQVWDMKVPVMPDDTVSAGILGGSMSYDTPNEDDKSDGKESNIGATTASAVVPA